MDIAQLGLSVDSSPARRAALDLDKLVASSRSAAAGADQLAGAFEREAAASAQSTAAHGVNARSVQVAGSASRAATAMISDNTKAMSQLGFQTKQTLIQLPDIFQGIAGGQGVFRTAIQQGGQLVQIYGMGPGGVGGSFRQVASELSAMITPMRLLGVGVAAVGVAAYAAITYWKTYALALDDLSHTTGTATTALSALQSAASIKGIGQDDFASGMKRFADSVYEAKAGTNDLAVLLRLNGKTVSDTAGTMDTVANLIRNARDDQQRLHILQEAGLPGTMEWVRLLRSGADGLRAAKDEAAKFGGAVNDEMVAKAREFDEAWNRSWTNFGVQSRSAIVTAVTLMQDLVSAGERFVVRVNPTLPTSMLADAMRNAGSGTQSLSKLAESAVGGYDFRTNGGGVRDAAWLAQEKQRISIEQQKISLLGEAATAADHRREVELRLQAADLAGIKLTDTQIEKIKRYAQEERSLAETQRALSVMGSAATEAEKYAARAQELGIALHHNVINQEQYNRALAYADPLFSGVSSTLSGLPSVFTDIASNTKSARDAFLDFGLSAAKSVEQLIFKLTIIDPLMKSLADMWGKGLSAGTIGGTGLPGFGGLFADGGLLTRGRWGIVGERGPELIAAHGGGVSIYPNSVTREMMSALPGFADGGTINSSYGMRPGVLVGKSAGKGKVLQ